jgi:hypothetical protein
VEVIGLALLAVIITLVVVTLILVLPVWVVGAAPAVVPPILPGVSVILITALVIEVVLILRITTVPNLPMIDASGLIVMVPISTVIIVIRNPLVAATITPMFVVTVSKPIISIIAIMMLDPK